MIVARIAPALSPVLQNIWLALSHLSPSIACCNLLVGYIDGDSLFQRLWFCTELPSQQ